MRRMAAAARRSACRFRCGCELHTQRIVSAHSLTMLAFPITHGNVMQKKLIGKILAILVVMALIGISLAMVQSTVSERMAFRAEAARSIAEDSVGEQRVLGPVLVVPYTEEYRVSKKSGAGEDESRIERIEARMLVFPNQMNVEG